MSCLHEGHDGDCSHETECACGEIARDAEAHKCKPIGWIDSWQLIGDPPETYIPLRPDHQEPA